MAGEPTQEVSLLLDRIRGGDESARRELLRAAYDELRGVAGNLFRDQPENHTLQPTALVNEVCIRMLGSKSDWNDRKHFIRAAARAMRNLLTDHARAKRAERRGGDRTSVTIDTGHAAANSPAIDLLALDETIQRLGEQDPRLGDVFELRFLAGLPVAQTAELVGTSERTVELDTRFIRAWLQKELAP